MKKIQHPTSLELFGEYLKHQGISEEMERWKGKGKPLLCRYLIHNRQDALTKEKSLS